MDSLETVSRFVDDFLNFSPDIDEQNLKEQNPQTQDEEEEESYQKPPQNTSLHTQTQLDILKGDVDSLPVVGEEELEWLLNENAFPPVEEPFAFPLESPKHQSPVSVLESGFRVRVRARSQRQRRKQFEVLGIFGKWGGEGKKRAVLEETKRKCSHCAAEKTPQWRAGPLGPKTLCNACGVRYKAGRLVPEYRPASSPSFSSDLHSNSHRKILEMRKKKQKALENG